MVYADCASTTPTDKDVIKAMLPYYGEIYGNPSSLHYAGVLAKKAIDRSTATVRNFLNAPSGEIIYTASGTESNNLAILGFLKANRNRGNHIVTTKIEHPSVMNTLLAAEKEGFKVSFVNVEPRGLIDMVDFKKAMNRKTILFITHLANSEIGVIQPVGELAKLCHKHGIAFHLDACQAPAYLKIDIEELGADMLAFNGSKVYGPKGVAVLYVKSGTQIFPIIFGGGQQNSLRSGTENVPGIVGLAKALEIVLNKRASDVARIVALRDDLQKSLEDVDGVKVNVTDSPRLCNHLSVTFDNVDSKTLVEKMNAAKIAVSAGSACSSRSLTGSYVLRAIGLSEKDSQSTIRISLGRFSTKQDIDRIFAVAKSV